MLLVCCLVQSWFCEEREVLGIRLGWTASSFTSALFRPTSWHHKKIKIQLFFFSPPVLEVPFLGHAFMKGSICLLELFCILLQSLQETLQGFLNLIQTQGGENSSTDKYAWQRLFFLCSVKDSSVSGLQVSCVFINEITDNRHWLLSTQFRKAICFQ